jgi:large subunit ribosomal protein L6
MSRIGKLPIVLPKGVDFIIDENLNSVSIKGPFGSSQLNIPSGIKVELKDQKVVVSTLENSLRNRALHGTVRMLLNNDITGVYKQFEIDLQLVGVGYRCAITPKKATLSLGFSHPIEIEIPENVTVKVENNTAIKILGPKKEIISQFASKIRGFRPPEPYNGKGVLYKNEKVIRKAGKSGKK